MTEREDREIGVGITRPLRSSGAPSYPAGLECAVTTSHGTTIHVRPIRPDDAPRLADFHRRLSPRSVYRRFLFVHPVLSEAEIHRFTCVDYIDRMALIIEDTDRLIAVGRYERDPGADEAEVAFVVADEDQHHGIGTLLLDQLAEEAWRNGITTFVASTLCENREMLDVFLHSGYPVITSVDRGVVSVRFPIEPNEAYRAAYAERHAQAQAQVGEPRRSTGLPLC
jgi:GNAT superfamily N-acetyltransferase